ncbi:hypothetical protein pb186bvf_017222 [Paramecium bursaria]
MSSLLKQYEKAKSSTKKQVSLTPNPSNSQTLKKLTPQKKLICDHCVNQKIIDQKQESIRKQKEQEQSFQQMLINCIDQENHSLKLQQQLRKEQLIKNFEINSHLVNQKDKQSRSQHQDKIHEHNQLIQQLQIQDKCLEQQRQVGKQQRQNYLQDLQKQINFQKSSQKSRKASANLQDLQESQYWNELAIKHEIEDQKRKIKQRQLINYWNQSIEQKNKTSDEPYIEDLSILRENEASKIKQQQHLESFRKGLQDQINEKKQKAFKQKAVQIQDQQMIKIKMQQDLLKEKQSLEQQKAKQIQFVQDIEQQIKEKGRTVDIQRDGGGLIIEQRPQSMDKCDDCQMQRNTKIMNYF